MNDEITANLFLFQPKKTEKARTFLMFRAG